MTRYGSLAPKKEPQKAPRNSPSFSRGSSLSGSWVLRPIIIAVAMAASMKTGYGQGGVLMTVVSDHEKASGEHRDDHGYAEENQDRDPLQQQSEIARQFTGP